MEEKGGKKSLIEPQSFENRAFSATIKISGQGPQRLSQSQRTSVEVIR